MCIQELRAAGYFYTVYPLLYLTQSIATKAWARASCLINEGQEPVRHTLLDIRPLITILCTPLALDRQDKWP